MPARNSSRLALTDAVSIDFVQERSGDYARVEDQAMWACACRLVGGAGSHVDQCTMNKMLM